MFLVNFRVSKPEPLIEEIKTSGYVILVDLFSDFACFNKSLANAVAQSKPPTV
jgi:hypothetical protein